MSAGDSSPWSSSPSRGSTPPGADVIAEPTHHCSPETIRCGETRTAALDATECFVDEQSYGDLFTFTGPAGQDVTIRITSSSFTPENPPIRPDGRPGHIAQNAAGPSSSFIRPSPAAASRASRRPASSSQGDGAVRESPWNAPFPPAVDSLSHHESDPRLPLQGPYYRQQHGHRRQGEQLHPRDPLRERRRSRTHRSLPPCPRPPAERLRVADHIVKFTTSQVEVWVQQIKTASCATTCCREQAPPAATCQVSSTVLDSGRKFR